MLRIEYADLIYQRHNRKQLDLSLSFRLSGLSSGAKLELVQLSRSPSVVTVALQLPEAEARGAPNGRLLDKFPSTTTLWLILRKFEAGVAGEGPIRNLTARGVPNTDGDSDSGRLFYEIPVLQILERELSSFADLQKSLAQLGFNSGNVLIRLNFRRTEETLEEAMVKIAEYFASIENTTPAPPREQSLAHPAIASAAPEAVPQPAMPTQLNASPEPTTTLTALDQGASLSSVPPEQSASTPWRSITVFSPPSENIPSSAQIPYNEDDYIPSVEHAKVHQRYLNQSSRPQRLPTDAEITAKAAAEEKRRADVREVEIKVRYPDQSQVVARFGPSDTGQSLYEFARSCLSPDFTREKFILNVFVNTGPASSSHANAIPESDQTLLIRDLGLAGRILVNFTWADAVASAAHQGRTDILRHELRSRAQEIKVEQPPELVEDPLALQSQQARASTAADGKPNAARKTGGVPKWLKLPGKK